MTLQTDVACTVSRDRIHHDGRKCQKCSHHHCRECKRCVRCKRVYPNRRQQLRAKGVLCEGKAGPVANGG